MIFSFYCVYLVDVTRGLTFETCMHGDLGILLHCKVHRERIRYNAKDE